MNNDTWSEREWLKRTLQAFWPAAFLLALILVLFPLSEVLVSTWPARPAELAWRWGAVGVVSRALMTPMLGLGIAVFWAALSRNRPLLLFLQMLALLVAIILPVMAVFFALDGIQLRSGVEADQQIAYAVATVQGAIKFLFASLALAFLGFGIHRYRKVLRRSSGDASSKPKVVFGQDEGD